MHFNPLGTVSLRTGFFSWLSPHSSQAHAVVLPPANDVQSVRQAMLKALMIANPGNSSRLAVRIRYCATPESLWDLRIELMLALAAASGEGRAREEMTYITTLFEGLVPAGLTSGPAPLR